MLKHITKPTFKLVINAWEPTLTPIFYHQELFSNLTFMRNGPEIKPEILIPGLIQVQKPLIKTPQQRALGPHHSLPTDLSGRKSLKKKKKIHARKDIREDWTLHPGSHPGFISGILWELRTPLI